MAKHEPIFPLSVVDYLADTTHLTQSEHGAYLLALLYEWRHGALPDDIEEIARIMRDENGNSSATPLRILKHSFRVPGRGWIQKRLEEERKKILKTALLIGTGPKRRPQTMEGAQADVAEKGNSSATLTGSLTSTPSYPRARDKEARAGAGAEFVKLFTSQKATTKAKAKPSKQHPRKNHSGARSAGANSRTVRTSPKAGWSSSSDRGEETFAPRKVSFAKPSR